MSIVHPRSLQLRLVVRLGVLLLIASIIAATVLVFLSYRTADSLSRRDLFRLADELADSIETDGSLDSVSQLAERGLLENHTVFAVRDADGHLLAASDDATASIAARRATARRKPRFFRLDAFGPAAQVYYGFDMKQKSAVGPVSVLVAEPDDAEDELLNAMLDEIAVTAAWVVPIFVVSTLLVGVFAIRGGLRPLRQTANQASSIKPEAISVRLDTRGLPSEVMPLVDAVNQALDRLAEGFELQRQFTANAAHELRTPLAIITGALEGIEKDGNLAELRQDVARMNRLVEQLLHVARLDSVAFELTDEIDLRRCAREAVERMAPLAIEQQRSIAVTGTESRVMIRGNRHAIGDALGNLIANALEHTPPGTEVLVDVSADGAVSVSDRGPGVPAAHREHVFDRFWRGRRSSGTGAGLGLSIVREIAKLHGATVEISDNTEGGACFTMRFAVRLPDEPGGSSDEPRG